MHAEPSQHSSTALRMRFVLSFLAIAGALFAIYTFPYEENGIPESFFASYLSWYARLAGGVLHLLDPVVSVRGANIVGRYAVEIVKSCDAMEVLILFSAAVLAFPVDWKRRLLGVAFGIPVLIAVNIARICSLYYVGVYRPSAFELVHIEVWPLILIAFAVTGFLLWATWANRGLDSDRHASA